MLFELSLIPLGATHISGEIAEALKIIDESGLPFQLTATGTCLEGEWDEVMPVLRQCHERVRQLSPHLLTFIKIEDKAGHDLLHHNVESVEAKLGHRLERSASPHLVGG